MLNFFGIKSWVWLGIILIVAISVYLILNRKEKLSNVSIKHTEKLDNVSNKSATIYNFNTTTCGWSKRFQPEWDKFTELAKSDPILSKVTVKDVKCDDSSNKEICMNPKYNVPGYPYVVLEIDDKILPYNGERTATSLASFCNQNIN